MGSSICPRCGTPRAGAGRFCETCRLDLEGEPPGGIQYLDDVSSVFLVDLALLALPIVVGLIGLLVLLGAPQ